MVFKKRSPAAVILLSIVTCGIYAYYWIYAATKEIHLAMGENDNEISTPGMCVLLTILTCGIYGLYWIYIQSQRIHRLGQKTNLALNDNSVINLILGILVTSIISYAIMQSDMNKLSAAVSLEPFEQSQNRIEIPQNQDED